MSSNETLLYVADPMCSWCWGFSPVVSAITERYSERVAISVIVGGLAPRATAPMDDDTKATVREHWDHVNEATGQPFDYAFMERERFVYNTEPPCRAVVAARQIAPDRALDFLEHLHRAFYRDNRDVTDESTLVDIGNEFGFDRAQFSKALSLDKTHEATQDDFELTRELGVNGFPSLLAHANDKLKMITVGYRPWSQIMPILDSWLERTDAQSKRA